MNRRTLLKAPLALELAAKKPPTLLVRSGWQTINIGDIAHTPGLLTIIERHVPDANVILWPNEVDRGVEPMLKRRFPKLTILKGADAEDVFAATDLMIHGSGPSVVGAAQVEAWRKATGKPYGIFGVTLTLQSEAASGAITDSLRSLLNDASFLYTRETASLANVRKAGIAGPEVGFVPDGTFSMDLHDEERAMRFLKDNALEPGKFICVIPRLRYTPYHKIRATNWSEAEIRRRDEGNERFAERDHAKLREVITAWVRKTGGKALLVPEMTYELDIIEPLLYAPLPDDVKKKAVRRTEYWLPDEAASVYIM